MPRDARFTDAVFCGAAPATVQPRCSAGDGQHREAPTPTSSPASGAECTAEEQQAVDTFLQSNNHYLGINRGVVLDSNVVRVHMKKMTTRVHPDKNRAPGSQQAFQKLQQAAQYNQDVCAGLIPDYDNINPTCEGE